MALKKKNKNISKLQKEYTEKYLKNSVQDETAKIDLNQFNMDKNENDLLYDKYINLSTKDLQYHLKSGTLSKKEETVVKKILNERK